MSAQHTPGPWELSGGIHLVGNPMEGGQHSLYCADIRHRDYIGGICTVQSADHCPPDGITRGTAEANARLIAVAPEMLSFLREIQALDEVAYAIGGSGCERLAALIAKATGSAA